MDLDQGLKPILYTKNPLKISLGVYKVCVLWRQNTVWTFSQSVQRELCASDYLQNQHKCRLYFNLYLPGEKEEEKK